MTDCRFCREQGEPVWNDFFKMWVHPSSPNEPWNMGYPVPCSRVIQQQKTDVEQFPGIGIKIHTS